MTDSTPRTVFVLGAGASKEANLPLGSELKAKIASALDIRFEHGSQKVSGDDEITTALRLAAQSATPPSRDINPYLAAAWRIRDAMPQAISIDNFVDSHADDPRIAFCGKLAIVKTILDAERSSMLYFDRVSSRSHLDFATLEPTWFNAFFQLLTENCRRSGVEGRLRSVALVIFNYDRCIEQYIYFALQNYYGMTEQEAAAATQALEIHHPYGQVGSLAWSGPQSPIPFGESPRPQQLVRVAEQIKTFTEGTNPADAGFQRITQLLATAPRLVFLGFAFHRLNIDLLFPQGATATPDTGRRVYATAFGVSASDIKDIATALVNVAGCRDHNIHIGGQLTCAGLFKEYWRSMSLA
ncbi:MAG: hypothetical protein JNL30_03810 [Rubrivivax sp.]|nr:hypothetical protein [Rubrivivax sp.]